MKTPNKTENGKSGSVVSRHRRKRFPAYIKLVPDLQGTIGDALKINGAEVRNDLAPLADGGGTDVERPSNLRGVVVKVPQNFALKHGPIVTLVQTYLQPQSNRLRLTSVDMPLETLAERLDDAMKAAQPPITASELSRACGVSPAAVGKWLNGGKMSADSLAAAARALGVRDDWLRTGRLPRERDAYDTQIDRVLALLASMREPLAALTAAIDTLGRVEPEARKRRHKP